VLAAALLATQVGYNKCFANGRSLFVNVDELMGLAPHDAREGDKILLFFGGRSPYVVRKLAPGRYRFIGACFLLALWAVRH
jgi:hypothetical protein